MKVLLDMNISPLRIDYLQSRGINAVHWSEVGNPQAPDPEIFNWARENDYIVFTNDLDFGAILAATNAHAPSVIQVRASALLPDELGDQFLKILLRFEDELKHGALITFDKSRMRARVLPFKG